MSIADGGDFGSGFASGFVSSIISSSLTELGTTKNAAGQLVPKNEFGRTYLKAAMIAAGGLSGAISARIAGGNFWDGMRQGLITAGLNHVEHMVFEPGGEYTQQQSAEDDGGGGDGKDSNPKYQYNGKEYSSKSELYVAILVDKGLEQLGVADILAYEGWYGGFPTKTKDMITKGVASSNTSLWSKELRALNLGAFQKAKWAPTLAKLGATTTSKAAFMARWIPWVSAAYLAYDISMTLYNTQVIYNSIINNGK